MALGKQAGHDFHQQHCLLKIPIYAMASQTDDLHPTNISWQTFLSLLNFLMWVFGIAAVAAQTDALYSTDLPADNKHHCCIHM